MSIEKDPVVKKLVMPKLKVPSRDKMKDEHMHHLRSEQTARKMIGMIADGGMEGYQMLLETFPGADIDGDGMLSKNELLIHFRSLTKKHKAQRIWREHFIEHGPDGLRNLHEQCEIAMDERGHKVHKIRSDESLIKSYKSAKDELDKRGIDPSAIA